MDSFPGQRVQDRTAWFPLVLLRLAFSVPIGLTVGAGHVWVVKASSVRHFNGVFFGVLLMALLPAGIYVVVIRSKKLSLVCGYLLLFVTAGGWFIAAVSKNDFRMVFPILAWHASLIILLLAVGLRAR